MKWLLIMGVIFGTKEIVINPPYTTDSEEECRNFAFEIQNKGLKVSENIGFACISSEGRDMRFPVIEQRVEGGDRV